MHEKHTSLVARAGWGKAIGFLFGLIGLLILAFSLPGTGWPVWLGTLFYFTNLGLLVGVLSVDLKHPLFPWEMKWWFIGLLIGGWVAFTLMLFIGDAYEKLLSLSEGTWRHFSSPLWLIVDGAIAGLIISWIVHRRVGD
jgi:hypothetical protein